MGGYGTVMKIEMASGSSNTSLAMKALPKNERGMRSVSSEILAMNTLQRHIKCPFVQDFHGAYQSTTGVFIMSQFISGGDAFYYLSKRTRFSENQVRIILAELYLALKHVHKCGLIHCDVKAENVMFDAQGHVKLVDFGLARALQDPKDNIRANRAISSEYKQHMKAVGSLPYISP
jgi:serine/threonine protein kinase